jgi:AraC-like DNA-binding protein
LAHLFIEPESAEGHALARRFGDTSIRSIASPEAQALSMDLTTALQQPHAGSTMVDVGKQIVARLAGLDSSVRPPLDPRIAASIEYLRGSIRNGTSLKEAAAVARLSTSRYRHLFVEQTGTSFRAYALWLRLNVAVQSATEGHSWTTCAHEAGFADSSHLTRTFKRMFGINPASLVLK